MTHISELLIVQDEVATALSEGTPVVALESTLITHGLPHPDNLRIAQAMEAAVRQAGAVPATIAVIHGRFRVGLDEATLSALSENTQAVKLSRRDLAIAVARQLTGGTTVAATMWIAHQAGIQVFATGGIGGVHRGTGADVSADLPELARTPVAVVCSGAKAILDLEATREWLETHGVPVLGYGTDEFPAFYSRTSGLPVDARVESPQEAAEIITAHWGIGLRSGVLIGVPVPEEAAAPPEAMESAIAQALTEAEQQGVRGKAVTPFLLARVSELTGGESKRANLALLEHNARVAGEIAKALVTHQGHRDQPARELILVSACLAGLNTCYDGTNNLDPRVVRLVQEGRAIVACPEQLGGLPTPREPAEIEPGKTAADVLAGRGRVLTITGKDVTAQFVRGAHEVLRLCQAYGIRTVVLKARSPSCGSRQVYDGTHSGRLIPGAGVTVELLRQHGIRVLDEESEALDATPAPTAS